MTANTNILISVVIPMSGGILGVMIGAMLTAWFQRRQAQLHQKQDVLRRLMGNRMYLTGAFIQSGVTTSPDGEPFRSLNEIMVVYRQHPEVMCALKQYQKSKYQAKDIVPLTKVMAKACQIREFESQDLVLTPFAPPSGPNKQ